MFVPLWVVRNRELTIPQSCDTAMLPTVYHLFSTCITCQKLSQYKTSYIIAHRKQCKACAAAYARTGTGKILRKNVLTV